MTLKEPNLAILEVANLAKRLIQSHLYKMIYTPREDSFLLEEVVKKFAKGKRVLDVGCGSGIQMKAAEDAGAKEVFGVDVDSESLNYCKGEDLNVVESDLFSKVEGVYDLIIFNPPYLPEDEREDSESAKVTSGGKKGNEIIVRFLRDVGNYLEKNGKILIVVSSLTPVGEIEKVLRGNGMEKKVVATKKLFMEVLEVWSITKT